LVDTEADISLLKGNKLIGTTECDSKKKVKVKCLDGSPMETHGVVEARIELSNSSIRHEKSGRRVCKEICQMSNEQTTETEKKGPFGNYDYSQAHFRKVCTR
jgi:hypothetical protein